MQIELATDPPFGHVVRQMNKMMDQLQKGYFNFCPAETWTPPVNLYESETAYIVCVDLSGVEKDKINLVINDNQLELRGQRVAPIPPAAVESPDGASRLRVHLMEIDYGPFRREVDLPHDIARDRIIASYVNGMLWIELPKK